MSAWITDRLPTREDGENGAGYVLCAGNTQTVPMIWSRVNIGRPWQPYPEPYQKPKVWGWGENTSTYANITKDKYVCFHIHFSDRITPAHIDAIVDALNRLEEGV